MSDNRAARDRKSIDKGTLEQLNRVNKEQRVFAQGIGGDPGVDVVPQYIKASSDKIIENGHNVSIVLGKDRPRDRLSGYGGAGNSHAGALDIVVGRLGHNAKSFLANGKRAWVDPDFQNDAARIYVSQKTDIDENFGLVAGSVGISRAKSGIALKADGIRIIGREGIKLITKTENKNSQGGSIDSIIGIDLIAGNDDKNLQPMVLGRSVVSALKRIILHLDKLNGIVDGMLMAQMTFNTALTHHFHFSPFFGLPTTPSPPVMVAGMKTMMEHLTQVKMSLITHKTNLSLFKFNYLNPVGEKWVCSRFHKCN